VTMPPAAIEMIRENLEWSTPSGLVSKIQSSLWKRDRDQLISAKIVLSEHPDEVDVFDVVAEDGVEQLCWGQKRILASLKGKVVEIGMDATCTF